MTGVQTCARPILCSARREKKGAGRHRSGKVHVEKTAQTYKRGTVLCSGRIEAREKITAVEVGL